MSEFLVVYLDSIDERLLDYLDEDGEMRLDAVRRLRFYTTALLDGSITPAAVRGGLARLVRSRTGLRLAYGTEELEELGEAATFLDGPEIGNEAPLTEEDRAYLLALERVRDMYPEVQMTEEE